MDQIEIETPHGPARAQLERLDDPRGAVLLGHGAGGGVGAPDLQAASGAVQSQGFTVALVEQPYRVAGRRSPAPAPHLDAAWSAVIAHLAHRELLGLPLVVGGRSLGARVACRTAAAAGAIGVLWPGVSAAASAAGRLGQAAPEPPARARGGHRSHAGDPGHAGSIWNAARRP